MKKIIPILALFIALINISLANDEWIKIPKDIQKKLGIKVQNVGERTISLTKKYPAIVKDDLTLSQAVYSPVEGIIRKLYVKEGDKVKKGQKLVAIYSPEIAKIITDIRKTQVEVKINKTIYEREKKLYQERLIPYRRLLTAEQQYKNSLAKLNALRENLKIYGETERGLLILRSNINGYIAKQNVILGDSVDINKLIFKIHSHEKLWVVAFIPVKDIKNLKLGQYVEILSPLGKTRGKLDFISHKVDPKTKRVEARIIADNRNEVLKPNMYVDVKIPLERLTGLFVPVSAVVKDGNKHYVFLSKGDKFKPVPVEIANRYGSYYEVKSGLNIGDRIVVNGTIYLKAKFFGEAEE